MTGRWTYGCSLNSINAWLFGLLSFVPTSRADVPATTENPRGSATETPNPLVRLASEVQAKLVKIYGAGGPQGLESYQSGFLVSDAGHVVTSWSTVLDVNAIRVVTIDGRRDEAEIVGMDPETEIAVLKMSQGEPNFFSMSEIQEPVVGNRVFGMSNPLRHCDRR